MDKNKRLTVWLPVIIAASIALGIFIGNHYFCLLYTSDAADEL